MNMPLYEYECEGCRHRFERIQKFSDPPAEVCPSCGKKKLRKLVSSPAIQFKGSGFYINDYARKGATEQGSEDSKASAAAKGDEKSSDKPAAASGTTGTTPASSSGSKESQGSKESRGAKESQSAKESQGSKDSKSSAKNSKD
jgi:putative FmdB family regulatory protein